MINFKRKRELKYRHFRNVDDMHFCFSSFAFSWNIYRANEQGALYYPELWYNWARLWLYITDRDFMYHRNIEGVFGVMIWHHSRASACLRSKSSAHRPMNLASWSNIIYRILGAECRSIPFNRIAFQEHNITTFRSVSFDSQSKGTIVWDIFCTKVVDRKSTLKSIREWNIDVELDIKRRIDRRRQCEISLYISWCWNIKEWKFISVHVQTIYMRILTRLPLFPLGPFSPI